MADKKPRATYTTYSILSYMFKKTASTTVSLYSTGSITYCGGANAFEITRAQAAYILHQSRSKDFHCTIGRSDLVGMEIVRRKVVDYR